MPAKTQQRKPDYKKKNYMREHYIRQGLTLTEIGNLNNVSAMTIRSWLNKLNIPVRPRGSRHPLNPKWNDATPLPDQPIVEQKAPSKPIKVIKNGADVDPAITHLTNLRNKLQADLANVEKALELVLNL